ncbi:MAG TPA: histidine kinase [Steroidobacteraceae bacterium]
MGRPGADSEADLALRGLQWGEWRLIWVAGGACWLIAGGSVVLWGLPLSGRTLDGAYYFMSTPARILDYMVVFPIAVCAYRLTLAVGWKEGFTTRVRIVLVDVLLALSVVLSSRIAGAMVIGFVDGHTADMWDTLAELWRLWYVGLWGSALCFFLSPYLMGLGAIALVKVTERSQREAMLATRLSAAYAEAQLSALSAQLQPHFLFNSLHAITRLIEESPADAATMVARLGDFLRHALETSHTPWVSVATELAGLEAYLEVQRARFSEQLTVTLDVSSAALELSVPSLLLQPLAENAIEHGRGVGGEPLVLRVIVEVVAEHLRFVVFNSGPRLTAQLLAREYGCGLSNVALRLNAAYGGAARLAVGPDEQGNTAAILSLPVRRHVGGEVPLRARP